MAGYLVHLAAMQQLEMLLKSRFNFNLSGHWNGSDIMSFDLIEDEVSWSVVPEKGNLFERMEQVIYSMSLSINTWGASVLNNQLIGNLLKLSHWITDCYTIGHMGNEMAKYEWILEPAGEFVTQKKLYAPHLRFDVSDFARLTNAELMDMFCTYCKRDMWHIYNQAEKVGKWNYIFSSAFRTAIRLQVLYSAETVATAFHIAGYLSSKKGGTL